MNEKLYKTISVSGVWSLVMGIITLITGVTSGVLLLISAARLLKCKDDAIVK